MNFRNIKYILTHKQSKKYESMVLDRIFIKLMWLMIKLQNKEKQVQNFLKSKNLSDTLETLEMAIEWLDIPISSVDLLCDFNRVRKQVLKKMKHHLVMALLLQLICFLGLAFFNSDKQINIVFKIITSITFVFVSHVDVLFLQKYRIDLLYSKMAKFIDDYQKSKAHGLRRIK